MTQTPPTLQNQPTRESLTAADRCDACRARAWVAATVNGVELLYCGHHANRFEERLRACATSFHDERPRLLETARAGRAATPVKRKSRRR